jgi:hypothetical protein
MGFSSLSGEAHDSLFVTYLVRILAALEAFLRIFVVFPSFQANNETYTQTGHDRLFSNLPYLLTIHHIPISFIATLYLPLKWDFK